MATILFFIINMMVWGALSELGLAGGYLAIMAVTAILSFVAILVHEFGHALAVYRTGGKIHAIVVVPFELRLEPRRLKLARRLGRRDIGGYVSYSARTGETRREHIAIAAAGPVANFALAVGALLVGFWAASSIGMASGFPLLDVSFTDAPSVGGFLPADAEVRETLRHARSSWISGHSAASLANALAILSAGMGAVNLIPFGGSDGEAIMRVRRKKDRR